MYSRSSIRNKADNLFQEFAFVMAAVTNYKGDPFDLLEHQSGLISYLFGKTRKKQINKDNFMKFQQDLMNDVLWMEFTRYSKDNQRITDLDFCNHILLCANITSKKKKQMVEYKILPIRITHFSYIPDLYTIFCLLRNDLFSLVL